MESNGSCIGEMSIGPWGGSGGKYWDYRSKNAITQIILIHNSHDIIDSIMFKEEKLDGSEPEYSKKFGGESGKGGTRTDKVNIDFPYEYLTGISGFFALEYPGGNYVVLKSIRFYTNRTEYGPFGPESGDAFSFRPKGAMVTGFFGRSGYYIDKIGVYFKHVSSVVVPVTMRENSELKMLQQTDATPGPWGGEDGRAFDDGVFCEVNEIRVHICSINNVISGVQFKYTMKDGDTIWSPLHGATGGDIVKKIVIDCGSDILIGIQGFYGVIEGGGGINVIKSLTFHTNKGKYGPFGSEIGKHFSSNVGSGKLVGFFGKSGSYLNAIGVHAEYF